MADETKIAPTGESKPEVKVETEVVKPEDTKVGDVVKPEAKPEEVKAKTVPEAVFLEEKRERKELAKQVKELTELMKDGASKKEVSADVKDIAEEFGLTEQAVSKLIAKVGEQTKAEYDKEIEAKLRPIQEKERSESVEKTFNEHFDKLMEAMPEYKNIANKDVIKTLSLDPKNANKTFAKILEDSYGHLVTGKKTLEKTQARGGVSDAPIDMKRMVHDMEYYKEVMANPELKKKYNDTASTRLRL
jgi:predicted transcriptional regulator